MIDRIDILGMFIVLIVSILLSINNIFIAWFIYTIGIGIIMANRSTLQEQLKGQEQ